MSTKEELLSLGWVVRPHGIQGEMQIRLHNPGSHSLKDISSLYLRLKPQSSPVCYQIEKISIESTRTILALKGCHDRNMAESFRKAEVLIDPQQLPELEEEEYYFFQLEGLPVYSIEGASLGVVQQVLESPANDLLVVLYQEKEVLVPVVESIVTEINIKEGYIRIQPIPGLFDDDTD